MNTMLERVHKRLDFDTCAEMAKILFAGNGSINISSIHCTECCMRNNKINITVAYRVASNQIQINRICLKWEAALDLLLEVTRY